LKINFNDLNTIEYCNGDSENYGLWFKANNLECLIDEHMQYKNDTQKIISEVIGNNLDELTNKVLHLMFDYIYSITDGYGFYEVPNSESVEYWLIHDNEIIWTEIINGRDEIFCRKIHSRHEDSKYRIVEFIDDSTMRVFDIQNCWLNEHLSYSISCDGAETPLWINPYSIELESNHEIILIDHENECIIIRDIDSKLEFMIVYDSNIKRCAAVFKNDKPKVQGFLYLIQPEEFKNTSTYKIGMTTRTIDKRMAEYNNPRIYLTTESNNIKSHEKALISAFEYKFGKPVHGREYFSGNINEMIELFNYIVNI